MSNVDDKTYEKTYHFFLYFQTSNLFLHVHKISLLQNLKKQNASCFNMSTKSSLFQQLWTIFWTNIMKNPTIFVTYFWNLFQSLHCHAVLLSARLYNKNDSRLKIANNLLFFFKGHFLRLLFVIWFFIWLLFWEISTISAEHYNAQAKVCY